MQVNNKPIISYVVERLERCKNIAGFIVATSDDRSDDPLAQYCHEIGIRCYRGALEDVIGRFLSLADEENFGSIVRICGDSPMIDSAVIDQAVSLFMDTQADVVCNVFPRSYPKGQSVEVIKTEALKIAVSNISLKEDREHVTTFLYKNSEQFKIVNFALDSQSNHIQLSVDTRADILVFEAIADLMTDPHWEYGVNELIALHDRAIEMQSV